MGRGFWPHLDRDEVGVGLLMRLAKPSLVAQRGASLCGPAAAIFNIAQDRPGLYAKFAIDLYEKGEAKMDYETVKPNPGIVVRIYSIAGVDAYAKPIWRHNP